MNLLAIMAARKKEENVPSQPEKTQKRPKKTVEASADAVTPELLSQLLAQVQQLTQEVSELRAMPAAAPVTQEVFEVDQEVAEPIEEVPELELIINNEPQNVSETTVAEEAPDESFTGILDEPIEDLLDESPEELVSPEEANALLKGFDEAMAESVEDEDAPMNDDQIAQLLSQAQNLNSSTSVPSPQVVEMVEVASEELSDFDIAAALEQGAEMVMEPETPLEAASYSEPDNSFDDFDLDSLTEEDLAAMVRMTINDQSVILDQQAEDKAQEEVPGSDVMSADDISTLLTQPDPEGEIVPNQSVAMDDDEISRLIAEASALGGTTAKPLTADDLAALGFNPNAEPAAKPAQPTQTASQPVHPAAVARNVQVTRSEPGEFDLGAVKSVPSHLAIRALALPVCFHEGKILCRVAEPIDREAIDRLSKAVGLGIVVEPAPVAEVVAGLRTAYAEVSDAHARVAMMVGAQKRVSQWEKFSHLWKKGA